MTDITLSTVYTIFSLLDSVYCVGIILKLVHAKADRGQQYMVTPSGNISQQNKVILVYSRRCLQTLHHLF